MTVVVVSWILVLLAAFGINYAHDVVGESRAVKLAVERHQLRAWAQSGVEMARLTLANTSWADCATLEYPGSHNPLSYPLECGRGRFAVGGTSVVGAGERWTPGLKDVGCRLPMALADSISLGSLPGMSPHGIETLLDARRKAGATPVPPFEMLAELDKSSLACAREYLSRYGSAVSANTASALVLRAIGLPSRAVDKLLTWRDGPDRIPGTPDDNRFKSLASNSAAVRACGLNSEEAAVLALLVGAKRLTVEPQYFRMASRSWSEDHKGICEIRVVIHKMDGGTTEVLESTEHWLN